MYVSVLICRQQNQSLSRKGFFEKLTKYIESWGGKRIRFGCYTTMINAARSPEKSYHGPLGAEAPLLLPLITQYLKCQGLEANTMPQCLRRTSCITCHALPQAEPPSQGAHFLATAGGLCLAEPRPCGESRVQDKREREGMSGEQPISSGFSPVLDHHTTGLFSL